MLNRWRWTAYSIAHLPVFFPLSIISAQAPLIEGQAYPLRADDVMRNTRCSRISSSRNRRQLEYPSCICIIRDRRRIRENAHVVASNRDRLTGFCLATLFLVSTRTCLITERRYYWRCASERTGGRSRGGTRFANSRLIEKLVRNKNRGG